MHTTTCLLVGKAQRTSNALGVAKSLIEVARRKKVENRLCPSIEVPPIPAGGRLRQCLCRSVVKIDNSKARKP